MGVRDAVSNVKDMTAVRVDLRDDEVGEFFSKGFKGTLHLAATHPHLQVSLIQRF